MKIIILLFHIIEKDGWQGANNIGGNGRIHEVISLQGNIMYYDAAISHKKIYTNDPKRNLEIFQTMIKEGITLKPREQFYYARELYYNQEYVKSIQRFNQFLNSKEGWIENNIEACLNLSKCYQELADEEQSLQMLFRSFLYDSPRAEICCEIGKYFFDRKSYQVAAFWYEIAVSREIDEKSGGFVIVDCYHYVPYMQLCVCYYQLGNKEKAIYCNEEAGKIKPDDKSYLFNKKFFESGS